MAYQWLNIVELRLRRCCCCRRTDVISAMPNTVATLQAIARRHYCYGATESVASVLQVASHASFLWIFSTVWEEFHGHSRLRGSVVISPIGAQAKNPRVALRAAFFCLATSHQFSSAR